MSLWLVQVLLALLASVAVHARVVSFDPDADLLQILLHDKVTEDLVPARPCEPYNCRAPNCRCANETIPRPSTPQMVIISVQNAVHDYNVELYLELFRGRNNPGCPKCPTSGTFFVSNEWSSPYAIQRLANEGHEIAMNGAKDLGWDFWDKATVAQWSAQINDNRQILSRWSNIPAREIRGFRVPNLLMKGNTQFQAYKNTGVVYDGTRVARNFPNSPNLVWPYTYDYNPVQECPIGECPDQSFPGMWQMPLAALAGPDGQPCSALRGCKVDTEVGIFNLLKDAFDTRYNTNRAPMMVSIDEEFLRMDSRFNGLSKFLDYAVSKNGYVVSAWQALAWIREGKYYRYPAVPLCPYPRRCGYDDTNKYAPSSGVKYITVCAGACPACYPRYGDPAGTSC